MNARRQLTLPYSEVCMFMGIAGQTMTGELIGDHAVQLYDSTGRPFSHPITVGEAGWGSYGSDHTITEFDNEGRWYPKGQRPAERERNAA